MHPEYLEFGKMAQFLGSSEDQLGALGKEENQSKAEDSKLDLEAWNEVRETAGKSGRDVSLPSGQ